MKLSNVILEHIEAQPNAHTIGLGMDGCPCFQLIFDTMAFEGHCWRSGPPEVEGCSLVVSVGDHEDVARAIAEGLKVKLDAMDWYGEWTVLYADPENDDFLQAEPPFHLAKDA